MTWTLVKTEDRFIRDEKPFISISKHRVTFGSAFSRLAEIGTQYRVSIFVDEPSHRLGFEFHLDEKRHSLALSQDNKLKSGKPSGLFCSSHGVLKEYLWLRAIADLPSRHRRFYPKQEAQMWVIELCPGFEFRFARESAKIPFDAAGVYRYLRENGEIVYIGRGNISNRLSAPDRHEWDFDHVEYSIIEDPDQQVKWETHWIERFHDEFGRLPFYNKVAGARKHTLKNEENL